MKLKFFNYYNPDQVVAEYIMDENFDSISDSGNKKAKPEEKKEERKEGKLVSSARFNVKLELIAKEDGAKRSKVKLILTHVGSNANGDEFTYDELKKAAGSIVGQKIDFNHEQDAEAIVGKVISAKFIESGDDSHVECIGELFDDTLPSASLARLFISEGIIEHISMECEFQRGQCSYCNEEYTSMSEMCNHLMWHKGTEYKGKYVSNILHDITFTGLGLLDKEGADRRATIKLAASKLMKNYGGNNMDNEKKNAEKMGVDVNINIQAEQKEKKEEKKTEEKEDVKKEKAEEKENDSTISDLEKRIEDLEKSIEAKDSTIQELEDEKAKSLREESAKEVMDLYKKAGREFNDESFQTEVDKLIEMSEEKFDAVKETASVFATEFEVKQNTEEEKEDDVDVEDVDENKTEASKKEMKSNANKKVKPAEDNEQPLAVRLENALREFNK